MAKSDAKTLRADPEAAAELPADDAGAYEHLHATPEYSWFVRLRTSRTATANPPADNPAVDGAGPATAADVPADGAGVDELLHADVQHPALLPAGRDAPCPGGYSGNCTARDRRRNKENQEEKLQAVLLAHLFAHS